MGVSQMTAPRPAFMEDLGDPLAKLVKKKRKEPKQAAAERVAKKPKTTKKHKEHKDTEKIFAKFPEERPPKFDRAESLRNIARRVYNHFSLEPEMEKDDDGDSDAAMTKDEENEMDKIFLEDLLNPSETSWMIRDICDGDIGKYYTMAEFAQDAAVENLVVYAGRRVPTCVKPFFTTYGKEWSISDIAMSEKYARLLHWIVTTSHNKNLAQRVALVKWLLPIRESTIDQVAAKYEDFKKMCIPSTTYELPRDCDGGKDNTDCKQPDSFNNVDKCTLCCEPLVDMTSDEKAEHLVQCQSVKVMACPALDCPMWYKTWYHHAHMAECAFIRLEEIKGNKGRRRGIRCHMCRKKVPHHTIRDHMLNQCKSKGSAILKRARKALSAT